MSRRVFAIILDGLGVGALPDAGEFGDGEVNTLAHMAKAVGGLSLPALEGMGLGRVQAFAGMSDKASPRGVFGRMAERSKGKDSTTGHWELAGLVSTRPFPRYPEGFPAELLDAIARRAGRDGFLGNEAASGTEIIQRLGPEHLATGRLIVYTSADSVFQVAAHVDLVPEPELYEFCEIARELLSGPHAVSRVIARPFAGVAGAFERTKGRRDFSLPPVAPTLLDRLREAGLPVVGVGKVTDLFAQRGFSEKIRSKSNDEGMAHFSRLQAERDGPVFCFMNLVDFDMIYGHRRDPEGYAAALRRFDAWLSGFLADMRANDQLFITADHGNDPTAPGFDHTREYVPILGTRPSCGNAVDLGTRDSFADFAATVAEAFGLEPVSTGRSFWPEMEGSLMDDAALCEKAAAAKRGAHAPYSGFRVGVALLCDDGAVLTAANLENASLGLSVCGERNVVARAVFEDRKHWRKLAVATDAEDFITPCGACRQVLREFSADLEIILVNRRGERRHLWLSELLPHPFEDYPRAGDEAAP